MIDLRSDTVTKPTQAMREALANADVGDDVYREDPTVRKLEETAAEILGKEAALFVTSGTQGNQIAVLTHTRPGDEVIVEKDAHVYYYEVGAMAALAGVQVRPVAGVRGRMALSDVAAELRGENIHFPDVTLLCLENTHNRAGGTVLPPDYTDEVGSFARARGITVHLDGARLFNAAVALGCDPRKLTAGVDSVQICLSKGLGAPVGSVLAGSSPFIERARKWRKALGGGMRQAGVIAAPGLIALTGMTARLAEDHAHARRLAEGLADIRGLAVDPAAVETNIVIVDVAGTGLGADVILARLRGAGVLATGFGGSLVRFVTHLDVGRDDIERAIVAIRRAVI